MKDVILIVEDDPQVARLIALVLRRAGRESVIVADGVSAMEKAKEIRPSMIFADLTIKGMAGDKLCSALKSQDDTKSIPYVVLSGDRDLAEKARQCGADDYMGKPFEFPDLIRLVDKYAGTESRKAD
ncbi:MAG TPA: response regulator [Thermoanaerobaculia bacterium]|nr:response regulator [Thermoanaerobaculia bacterium]